MILKTYNDNGLLIPPGSPTMFVKPMDIPRLDFLLTFNYLSEYRTEVEKSRVRANLGIPDDFTLRWGSIQGLLEKLSDLVEVLNGIKNDHTELETIVSEIINKLKDLGVLIDSNNISNLSDRIEVCENELLKIEGILNELETLGNRLTYLENNGTGGSYDDTLLRNLISQKLDKITDLEAIRTKANGAVQLSDLEDFALLDLVPTKTSQLINDSNFLTTHIDISGKLDKLTPGNGVTILNNTISILTYNNTLSLLREYIVALEARVATLEGNDPGEVPEVNPDEPVTILPLGYYREDTSYETLNSLNNWIQLLNESSEIEWNKRSNIAIATTVNVVPTFATHSKASGNWVNHEMLSATEAGWSSTINISGTLYYLWITPDITSATDDDKIKITINY